MEAAVTLGSYNLSGSTTEFYVDYDYNDSIVPLCQEQGLEGTTTAAWFIVIFIVCLTGNTLVLCVLIWYEKVKEVSNLFVMNLAISHLVFAISLPFWSVYHFSHWIFGEFLCKLLSGMYFIGLYSSLMLLTAMTIDRYLLVVYNWFNSDMKRKPLAWVTCIVVWLISISVSVKDMVESQVVQRDNGSYYCEANHKESEKDQVGYYLHIVFFFLLPLAIIIFCYIGILRKVLKCTTRKKHRTVVVVFCIVVAFFVCWVPYNLLIFLKVIIPESASCATKERVNVAFDASRILAYSHCCLNPILYSFTQKFRTHFANLFLKVPLQKNTNGGAFSNTHSLTNTEQKDSVSREAMNMI